MFRPDSLSDTTPAVLAYVQGLAKAPPAGDAQDSEGSGASTTPGELGHVYITSLRCVSKLARSRQLLLQPRAPPSTASFVRVVVSLLGYTLMDQVDGSDDSEAAPLPWWTPTQAKDTKAHDVEYAVALVDDTGGVRSCRIALRSKPVSVFSAAMVDELTVDAQQCSTAATPAPGDGGATRSSNSSSSNSTSSATEKAATCVPRAVAAFHSCVQHHEAATLQNMALGVARLLDDHDDGGGAASPEWMIDVPLYSVVLCVEDTHTTRLHRVQRLTTPLLRAATTGGGGGAADGPLGAVTRVLATLHTWCAASLTSTAPPGSSPPQCTLTHAQLRELHQSMTSLCCAETRPVTGDAAAAATPACVVHCQLGVSRSPSVVLLFYMDVFASQLRAAVAASVEAAVVAESSDTATAAAATAGSASLAVFNGLLGALVLARARVRPNVCFAAQLLSHWAQCTAPHPPPSAAPPSTRC
ncbi:Dual specificity phosphatase, catalytic domain containing protein [Novymonas esmeraldas]|uniref:Dual specificity phosphatase, catalytic domain containing protein n=1 Tax=Novymonas esmeraldas TaxID=1808958 RepID=A0AAW0EPQ5_9TRYP